MKSKISFKKCNKREIKVVEHATQANRDDDYEVSGVTEEDEENEKKRRRRGTWQC